ncbi:integral membrane protein [Cellulomonas flavigena DSM 20109]|uniref:Integral membrane protein n=1 Tax=Cellulomonas flavigena (strain ATCC 482 / DSM 20109 / BCRC 11376 / JCM 18109 / NBRC 3775 / NCIMB 8073 / NRS 134) TaxID=446466 RepID=D5ULH0_CELFN|nr:hypothetical protein [Cellulomonas flavigena]ADG74012.1 integral membrane protein [Cellulomonas flavigena DSM 20109]
MSAPTRRPARSPRRALVLLVCSGLALVGVVVLAVGWIGIGTATLQATAARTEPCLLAYVPGTTAEVRYEVLPARAVCEWDVDGVRQEVVVASVPVAVTAPALLLALGGVAGTVAALLSRRTVAPGRGGPVPGPGAP